MLVENEIYTMFFLNRQMVRRIKECRIIGATDEFSRVSWDNK